MVADFMNQINEATTTKPILISEYAVIEQSNQADAKARWIREALRSISDGRHFRVKGVSYWNSPGWLPGAKADLRIDSSPWSLESYRFDIARPFWLTEVELSSAFTW
jgi:hypothetical protein